MAVAIALSLVFEMELFLVKDYSAYRENKIIIPGGIYIYFFFFPCGKYYTILSANKSDQLGGFHFYIFYFIF